MVNDGNGGVNWSGIIVSSLKSQRYYNSFHLAFLYRTKKDSIAFKTLAKLTIPLTASLTNRLQNIITSHIHNAEFIIRTSLPPQLKRKHFIRTKTKNFSLCNKNVGG